METVQFRDLGRMEYQEAWDYQSRLHQALIDNKLKNRDLHISDFPQNHYLLFVEHPPVYTLGKSGSEDHVLLSKPALEARGIGYFPINRGGDITYHGPGQIVGYPILDLDRFFNDVHRYVRSLEEVIIRTLAEFGLKGKRIQEYTGVWIDQVPPRDIPPKEKYFFASKRKICAIGVHMSRWVTLHGFAMNVNTDLSYFDHIVPCGITDADKRVTSLQRELGEEIPLEAVKSLLLKHFCAVFDCNLQEDPTEIITQQ